ncbi:hypothetical protein SLOPH_1827, partial [Spraguea lophii 42_110]
PSYMMSRNNINDNYNRNYFYYNEYENNVDSREIKSLWKKERNRLAAKKSREKKAVQLKELEEREKRLVEDIDIMKECTKDYDNILNELMIYIEKVMNGNCGKDNLVELFEALAKLKKPGTDYFIVDIAGIGDMALLVNNQRIEVISRKIKRYLNDMWYRNMN